MSASPTIPLKPTGAKLPQIGFGTWKHYGEKASEAVYAGAKAGYRLFDGAAGESLLSLGSRVSRVRLLTAALPSWQIMGMRRSVARACVVRSRTAS